MRPDHPVHCRTQGQRAPVGYIERTRELDELTRLLASTRLFTVIGVGGSSKARLAREVATRAASNFTCIAWVDLALVTEAAPIAPAIAAPLHVPEHAAFATIERVMSDVMSDSVLLARNNCEHLVGACAELAETLHLPIPEAVRARHEPRSTWYREREGGARPTAFTTYPWPLPAL